MIVIISPAKTLDFKTHSSTRRFSIPDLLDDSQILIQELKKLNPTDIMKLMKVNSEIATLNFERNLSWRLPFTLDNAKQALLAFKGQVFVGLDANTLTEDDLIFAQNHLRILSGFYGILRPLDLIQAYRLEMGIALKNPKGKNLYEFWGTKITKILNKELEQQKENVLINLASNEYFKSVNPKQIQADIITPVFKELRGNEYKTITVYAKTARGYMSRFIIENRITNPNDIKSFDVGGYLYSHDLSNAKQWVFVR
ncbi:MAG: peroxide stress protein YaaA [Bacteroidales bacterium]|nr:peroxide stress protein YaaA [Bacteroidales bacterium]